jgi:hypothetical protein
MVLRLSRLDSIPNACFRVKQNERVNDTDRGIQ